MGTGSLFGTGKKGGGEGSMGRTACTGGYKGSMKEIWRHLDGRPKNKELWSYVVNLVGRKVALTLLVRSRYCFAFIDFLIVFLNHLFSIEVACDSPTKYVEIPTFTYVQNG